MKVQGDLFHGVVPAGAVYVGRAAPGLKQSQYRNAHRVGKPCRACEGGPVHTLLEALALYERDLYSATDLFADARTELTGRDLACWCRTPEPGEPDLCHAAVLLVAVNVSGASRAYPPGPKPYAWPRSSFAPLTDIHPIGEVL